MKTKFYWFALLATAAMIGQANARGKHGGGGAGRGDAPAVAAPSRAGSSFRSAPFRGYGGGRMLYSGHRYPSAGFRSSSSTAFRGRPMSVNRGTSVTRSSNRNRAIVNARSNSNRNAQIQNRGTTLRADWRKHVFAQHSANWQRHWNRHHDHWWHGHRCRFINGSWVIFNSGYDPFWPYWYPYNYYPYSYYPYAYGPYADYYYDQNDYGSADPYGDSVVAAAQERLAQQGYYRAEIDGVFGPATRRAIARYQSNNGLRVSGSLDDDTLEALGLSDIGRS